MWFVLENRNHVAVRKISGNHMDGNSRCFRDHLIPSSNWACFLGSITKARDAIIKLHVNSPRNLSYEFMPLFVQFSRRA